MNVCINYNDRIDISETIDVNKTDFLCKCIICHCWYFLNIDFKFQSEACNGCHDLIQKAMNFNVAIATVKRNDYRIRCLHMSKDKTINLLRNADLTEQSRTK